MKKPKLLWLSTKIYTIWRMQFSICITEEAYDVRKDMQGKGVNAILMNQLTRTFIKNGIKYAESNPEPEDNTKVQSLWENYEAV